MRRYCLVLPLLAMSVPVWGQGPRPCGGGDPDCLTEREQKREQVVHNGARRTAPIKVIGNTLPKPIGDTAYSEIEIAVDSFGRVENVLRDVPGLQQFRRSDARSANPTSQGITLRGLGGNASSRALLLLDGVPQADPFGGWISWPGYDALPIERATIRRGSDGGVNGPGAISGSVELLSKTVGNLTQVGLAYGSRDSTETNLVFGRAMGGGQLTISGTYKRGDGFTPIIKSQRGTVDRQAGYEQAGLAVRYVAPVTGNTELQANIRAFTDDRERGFAFSENHNDGADASIRLVNQSDTGWQWSALGYVQIRNFDVSFGGVAADRGTVNRVFEQFNVPSTGLGARLEVRPPVGETIELRIGGDWRRAEGVTNENFFFADNETPRRSRRAGGSTTTFGSFVEVSVQANDALIITGGGRVDFWSINDGFRREIELINPAPGTVRNDSRFADRSGSEFTGRGGFAYSAGSNLTLRGAAYLGWRLPTLNELFRPFRVGADATAANELLAPERLKGAELGMDWAEEQNEVHITAFYNKLDNAIANVTLDAGPGLFPGVGFVSGAGVFRQRQNLDHITSKGIEIDADFDLSKLVDNLRVRAGYSFVDAEVNASGSAAAVDGLRPAQIPKHNAFAQIAWQHDNTAGFAFAARYIGGQYEDDQNSRNLRDAVTVDANVYYPLGDRLQIEARAENLFDARVEAAISSGGTIERATPRTFWIVLRAKIE